MITSRGTACGCRRLRPREAEILCFVAEFSAGTLRNLLLRQPGRLRLLAGKFTALAAFLIPAAWSRPWPRPAPRWPWPPVLTGLTGYVFTRRDVN